MGDEVIAVPAAWAARTGLDRAGLDARAAAALADPAAFWADEIDRLDWVRRPTRMDESSFAAADFGVRWFADGTLNVAANCLDRHLADRGDQPAILWEPDDPAEEPRTLTYRQLHAEVGRFAAALADMGVDKGDRVMLYLPMVPEAAVAMLACARLGAIHTVVFGGFSPESIAGRVADCSPKLLVTADEGRRGGKRIPLKANVDAALAKGGGVETVVVLRATNGDIAWVEGRDRWWHEAMADAPADLAPVPVAATDPLFILYTSGSTGKPKGVVHSSGGYLLWAALTYADCFGIAAPEVFWCAADVGWITGHSYIVYGPLAAGATTLMYEGLPNWPTPSRIWEVVDRHRVAALFTAPTVLRALMREGDAAMERTSRASLTVLGSVGEPINPEAWRWYHQVVGGGRCPIVDMWWQTETGGGMIAPLPGTTALKPGSATLPLPGVAAEIVDADGCVLDGAAEGNLVIARSWPGQMTGVWGDPDRFFQIYFTTFPGKYATGDGARRDADGYYWITGRVDDVINVSGHRMGTAEVESALVLHPAVAEAAVVGFPHDIKGQGIYAYVTLKSGQAADDALLKALRDHVRREIGPIATPDAIQFAPGLPKTRSGKIMRRILRKIAENELGALGDTSTLADPGVVDDLVANRVR